MNAENISKIIDVLRDDLTRQENCTDLLSHISHLEKRADYITPFCGELLRHSIMDDLNAAIDQQLYDPSGTLLIKV